MSIKSWIKQSPFVISLITGILFASIPYAYAAPTYYFDTLKSSSGGCVNLYTSAYSQTGRLIARKNIRISAINVAIGNSTRSNFNTSTYNIYSNNVANDAPNSQLAVFTPETITGTGNLTVARYVGDYSISAGTKFWIVPGQLPSVQAQCYFSTAGDPTELNMNGVTTDSSTSLSNSSYWRAYTASASPVGANWQGLQNFSLIVQLSIEAAIAAPVSTTISTQSGQLQATYRSVTTLVSTVNTPSKVTFFANGKVIAGCRNVLSSSGSASCSWKPSLHGSYRLHASANPLDDLYVASNSSSISVGVGARTNRR